MDSPIRILLLDDHGLFREGLARMLSSEPGFVVVGHCGSIDEALQIVTRMPVDLILLDYDLGNETGTDILGSLAVLKPAPRVLIVTAGMTEKATRDAFLAGAVGIVHKHSGPQHLIDAIRHAVRENARSDVDALIRAFTATAEEAQPLLAERPLTRRQSKALLGILDGLGNREIADRMNVSESSVKAIVQELFNKAGVRTRSQLVRVAIEKHSDDWIRAGAMDADMKGARSQ